MSNIEDLLLQELDKTTAPIVVVPVEDKSQEQASSSEYKEDFAEENYSEEDKTFSFGEMIDPEETADMAIHILDVVNTEVSSFLGNYAFFNENDKIVLSQLREKMNQKPNFSPKDFSEHEKLFYDKYERYETLKERLPFTEKTKKNLRTPLVKILERFKWTRLTPLQAVLFIVAMNNLPFLIEILPQAFIKFKNQMYGAKS